VDADAYCREIEAHLCRRNAGHLVRVAGPAFEMVAGWAAKGIPLKVALGGIDRAVERRDAKGPSRRPLRIEFCEADVLDAFDAWRRAVGVGTASGGGLGQAESAESAGDEPRQRSGPSLRAHLDRVVARLTDCLASGAVAGDLERVIDRAVTELGDARAASRGLRGDARAAFITKLQGVDDELMAAARAATPPDVLEALGREAGQDLAAFRGRMSADDYSRAVEAATVKLLRERLRLPDVGYEV
jgi:hypothetical protein